MNPAEPRVGLFGKAWMRFDKVFVDASGIVHSLLPVIILMTIARSLPGIVHLVFSRSSFSK
jgi:hypothetical protein